MSLTKASYSMITAAPINVYDYGAVGDGTTDDTAALQAAVTAATGKQLWLGTGVFKTTATINLPSKIRITGATNRARDTQITAAFAGPALKYTSGSGTALEMYLEHFSVQGNYPVYGAGNGIEITNGSSLNMHSMVVAGFGTNQVNIGTGSYGAIIRDCYFAETYGPGTSNANLYCASEFCLFDKIESDDGKYSIYLATGAYGTDIINSTLEGWSVACIKIQNSSTLDRNLIQGNKINGSRGGTGITTDSNRTHIINNYIALTSGTSGIVLDTNSYGAHVIGNSITGTSTGINCTNSGLNTIVGNEIVGNYALDINSTTYASEVVGNYLAGTTTALIHRAGNLVKYSANRYDNASGTYSPPTVVAGSPNSDFWVAFTPTLLVGGSATGITYATNSQTGYYTKVGNTVFFNVALILTSIGSNSGALTVSGLPFASLNNTIYLAAVPLHIEGMASTAATMITAKIPQNSSAVSLYKFAAGASSTLNAVDVTNTSTIILTGNYLTTVN